MTATSLMSPPSALAINTMTVAAPGEEPQTAVVPGSTLKRARSKPSVVAKTMTMPMQVMNIGHWRSISIRMSGLMLRATRQPTTPCATMKDQAGILTRPSNHASRIAAPIDPRSNAAGRPINSRTQIKMSDAPRSAHHCRGAVLPRSVKSDIGPWSVLVIVDHRVGDRALGDDADNVRCAWAVRAGKDDRRAGPAAFEAREHEAQ